jgi:hypothetical protein
VKPDFARAISPKHVNRRKVVWLSSEKRPFFAHTTALKTEPFFEGLREIPNCAMPAFE